MASPSRLILKIQSLVIGDSIGFLENGTAQVWNIVALSSAKYELSSTGVLGGDYAAISARNEFEAQLGSAYSVTRNGQNVTIEAVDTSNAYNFGFPVLSLLNGSQITVIDYSPSSSTTGGSSQTGDPTGLGGANIIRIDSIIHEKPDLYPSVSEEFAYGSSYDFTRTTIDFTINNTLSKVSFKYGYAPTNGSIYTNTTNQDSSDYFQVKEELFVSRVTSTLQSYTGDLSGMAHSKPIAAQTGTCVLTSLGGNQYRIVQEHYWPIITRPEDVSSNTQVTFPVEYEGDNDLGYVFQIDVKGDAIDPQITDTTKGLDLSELSRANVGYVNEFLNGEDPNYLTQSFSFDNDDNELDDIVNTTASAVIKNDSGNFTATSDILLMMHAVTSDFNGDLTLLDNISFEKVALKADGVPVLGTNIVTATAAVDGGDPTLINLSFEVLAGAYSDAYTITAIVSNDTVNVNHNRIILRNGDATSLPGFRDLQLVSVTGGAVADDFIFTPDYDTNPANGFNHPGQYNGTLVGDHVEERRIVYAELQNNDISQEITRLTLEIKSQSTGQSFDKLVVDATQLDTTPIDTEREWILGDSDIRKDVKISRVGNIYSVQWPFIYWQNWVGISDMVFSLKAEGTETVNGETFQLEEEFLSPNFSAAGYNTTRNTALEPQVELKSISYFESTTLFQVGGIVKNASTIIEFEFEDNNLNDLQTDLADLWGFIGVRPKGSNELDYRIFHSIFEPETDSPFSPVTAQPFNLAYIEKPDIKTAKISGVINWDELVLAFPDVEEFEISAHMDRVQPSLNVSDKIIPINWFTDYQNFVSFRQTESMSLLSIEDNFFGVADTEFVYKFDPGPTEPTKAQWDIIAPVSFAVLSATLAAQNDYWVYIGVDDSPSLPAGFYIDGARLKYQISGLTGNSQIINPDYVTNNNIDQTRTLSLDTPIQITSESFSDIQVVNYDIRLPGDADSTYVDFQFSNITDLNNFVSANLVDGDKYIFRFMPEFTGSTPSLTLNIEFPDQVNYTINQIADAWTAPEERPLNDSWQSPNNTSHVILSPSGSALNTYLDNSVAPNPWTFEWWGFNNQLMLLSNTGRSAGARTGIYVDIPAPNLWRIFFGAEIGLPASSRRRIDTRFSHYNFDGYYYHVLLSYDGSRDETGMNMYVNGYKMPRVSNFNNLDPTTSTLGIDIGSTPQDLVFNAVASDLSQRFSGNRIAKIKFYEAGLTDIEALNAFRDPDYAPVSLARNWDFNQIIGTSVTETIIGENGTIVGDPGPNIVSFY